MHYDGQWLNENDEFYVELTAEGYSEVLRTCKSKITLRDIPKLYPNPTSGQIIITNYELRTLSEVEVEIYDIYGKNVISLTAQSSPLISIDISHLANGMYFLRIGNQVFKVVKE